MNIKDLFLGAFALINNPATWTTRHNAVDYNGEPVHYTSEEARKWCQFGALMRVSRQMSLPVSLLLFTIVKKSIELYHCNPITVNDILGHDAIVRVWREVGEENDWLSKSKELAVIPQS